MKRRDAAGKVRTPLASTTIATTIATIIDILEVLCQVIHWDTLLQSIHEPVFAVCDGLLSG